MQAATVIGLQTPHQCMSCRTTMNVGRRRSISSSRTTMPPNSSSSRLNDWPINKPRIWWQDLTATRRERDAMRMTSGSGRWSGSSEEKDDAYRVMARWCCYCCCFNCCCWCTVWGVGRGGSSSCSWLVQSIFVNRRVASSRTSNNSFPAPMP